MSEKQVVFDVDGNPKELRYYEHDRLTARLGVILDGDKNFIGLRELDVAEVSPPSWLEKLKQWGKPPPKPSISILTVDFIGLINWINTIKTIKTIENIDLVDRIALIDNITNVGTLNLLNTVNLIKSISSIDSITNIANISKIGDVSFPLLGNYIVNGNFQFGDFRGWYLEGTAPPTISNGFSFSTSPYCAKIAYSVLGASNHMTSYFNRAVKTNDIYLFTMTAAYDNAAATKTVAVFFLYSDRSYSEQDVTVTNAGVTYNLTPTANKTLIGVVFANSGTDGYYAYVNTIILLAREHTEREDLLCKSFDLTVGTTSLLGAVAGQSHKVYGWDYESDTDGANEFSATISGATTKFARRVTAGVHAMTLVHPIVCDVNTALSFVSAGNTKLSLRYKTEA